MTPDFEYIVTSSRLEKIVDECLTKPYVAIDTEFARFKTYYPIVGLIQIHDGESCYLIDPLAIEDYSDLTRLIRAESVIKIFHACSEDLEVFQHCLGEIPNTVFDTQIAGAILGVGFSLSYQNMVENYLSVKIPKEETRSDWLKRPLTDAQLDYAALDVIYLLKVFKLQYALLEQNNKLSWVEQECNYVPDEIATRVEPEDFYLKVKNTTRLDRRQLGYLRSLCAWRETKARELDVPRNRVVEEKSLFLIAQLLLKDKSDFQELAKLSPRQVRKYGDELLLLVNDAAGLQEDELPGLIVKPGTPVSSKSIQSLRKVVDKKALEIGIAPEMLAKRRHLEQLLRSVDEHGRYSLPVAFRGWREEIIGHALLESLSG